MATKQDAINYLIENYELEDLGDDSFKMLFNLDEGRSQLVFVGVFDEIMTIDSPFATTDDINANIAFKLGEDSILGIKKFGETYALRHIVPLEDVDASEIDLGLGFTARAADALEAQVGGDKF